MIIIAVILEQNQDAGLLEVILKRLFTSSNEQAQISYAYMQAINVRNRHPTVSQNCALDHTAFKVGDHATVYFYLIVIFFPFSVQLSLKKVWFN